MASIRRTLSPVPRPGALMNGEACQVASPLSKSSSNSLNYPPHAGVLSSSLGSLNYVLYKTQNSVLGLFSQRYSRPFDRSKVKGQIWRRALFHFIVCFTIGVFVGFTPFVQLNASVNVISKNQAFNFEVLQPVTDGEFLSEQQKDEMLVVGRFSLKENSTSVPGNANMELKAGTVDHDGLNNSPDLSSDLVFHKLLIIVTPTHVGPLQMHYLNRLAHTLKLVPHPLLWIVVEMNSQSAETAELLRNAGVVYRHLICSIKNSSEIKDRSALLRNVALLHIETHRLDGIVYFADGSNIYSTDLFDQMRMISRFGTWTVAKLVESEGKIFFEGPICNGSQVLGWHVIDMAKRVRRFHAEMSGFAFNSSIIWDPKRWHRPTLEPIRQSEIVKEDFQASTFIEQVVEDESQMECFSLNSSAIMVWHHTTELDPYSRDWYTRSNNLATLIPLK